MALYCYTLSLDGAEQQLAPADHPDNEAAIAWGRRLLTDAVSVSHPRSAYVAVFEDEGVDDEPLGAWDWSREAPEPAWSPED